MNRPRTTGRCLDNPWHRTYLTRRPRMSKAQKANLNRLFDDYGLTFNHDSAVMEVEKTFESTRGSCVGDAASGRSLVIELGFGSGESMLESASRRSETHDYVGVEVHKPGIATALKEIEAMKLNNVRVVNIDGVWLMRDFIPENSVSECCVYFPDPWTDERKAHRRLVNPLLLSLLERVLVRDGRLSVATDDDNYAAHVERVMREARERGWYPSPDGGFDRFESKYSRKGVDEGRSIKEFAYRFAPIDVA